MRFGGFLTLGTAFDPTRSSTKWPLRPDNSVKSYQFFSDPCAIHSDSILISVGGAVAQGVRARLVTKIQGRVAGRFGTTPSQQKRND